MRHHSRCIWSISCRTLQRHRCVIRCIKCWVITCEFKYTPISTVSDFFHSLNHITWWSTPSRLVSYYDAAFVLQRTIVKYTSRLGEWYLCPSILWVTLCRWTIWEYYLTICSQKMGVFLSFSCTRAHNEERWSQWSACDHQHRAPRMRNSPFPRLCFMDVQIWINVRVSSVSRKMLHCLEGEEIVQFTAYDNFQCYINL